MEKDLIILIVYVNFEHKTSDLQKQQTLEFEASLRKMFENTNKDVKIICLPVIDQETKIECIYPPISLCMQDKEVKEFIKNIEEKLKTLLLTLKN